MFRRLGLGFRVLGLAVGRPRQLWMGASYWICSFANNQWDIEGEPHDRSRRWGASVILRSLPGSPHKGTLSMFGVHKDECLLVAKRPWQDHRGKV